ncbi:MAG: 1-acyl-sn-glycerol-3-phosphate acyltransferase [Lachnospiraceae bacterium]|nr:1-acyl-sn-glycerol-3-phosphate acyltransferase [Lachnospiraceae bacterium]
MKIKVREISFDELKKLKAPVRKPPSRPDPLLSKLINVISRSSLKKCNFRKEFSGMEKLKKDEPCLILMNHSSFIDLSIASEMIYPRPYQIICTTDGFVGKEVLMRKIGCIPTLKFVMDVGLIKDMTYAINELKTSVLMYPEAGYSLDGTATALPDSLGKCVKKLKAPLIIINTYGAFARDPLYNMLQIRKVDISARMEYVLSPEEIDNLSAEKIGEIIQGYFSFDNFRWQQENHIKIDEPFRADGLNRVLYKCPHCNAEGKMTGKGIHIKCDNCNASYTLDEYGFLKGDNVDAKFTHVPNWFKWERECVREELKNDEYSLKADVDIYMIADTKYLYKVGTGVLKHSKEGFRLTGCDGNIDYRQKPSASYSLNADYYWYEIGDMIGIGNMKAAYYCFPKNTGDIVAKTRLATEELYKLCAEQREKT